MKVRWDQLVGQTKGEEVDELRALGEVETWVCPVVDLESKMAELRVTGRNVFLKNNIDSSFRRTFSLALLRSRNVISRHVCDLAKRDGMCWSCGFHGKYCHCELKANGELIRKRLRGGAKTESNMSRKDFLCSLRKNLLALDTIVFFSYYRSSTSHSDSALFAKISYLFVKSGVLTSDLENVVYLAVLPFSKRRYVGETAKGFFLGLVSICVLLQVRLCLQQGDFYGRNRKAWSQYIFVWKW